MAGLGKLATLIALSLGLGGSEMVKNAQTMLTRMKYAYRDIPMGGRRGSAAADKRAAKKRRNIAKRLPH